MEQARIPDSDSLLRESTADVNKDRIYLPLDTPSALSAHLKGTNIFKGNFFKLN